jgi:hypothetical protein
VLTRTPSLLNQLVLPLLPEAAPTEAVWRERNTHVLSPVQPARAADGVLSLEHGTLLLASAVLEVQLAQDEQKRHAWPGYLGGTASRFHCPVALCIFTFVAAVTSWARSVMHPHPSSTTRVVVLGPEDRLDLATLYPHNAVYQLLAWACGFLHDQIEQNAKGILHATLALDSAHSRGYFYFMMAVADRLPSPFKEHVMNELKDYRFLFPIHDHEFDLVEKGERQGIEKGIELGKQAGIELGKQAGIELGVVDGRLQHARATLERLDAAAAAELGPCTELRQWDAAIEHAIQQLKAGK